MRKVLLRRNFIRENGEDSRRLYFATRLVARCYSFNDCGFKYSNKFIVV